MALTEWVMMPGTDYQSICDAIRAKNGQTADIKSGEAGPLILNLATGGSGIPDIFSVFNSGEFTYDSDTAGSTAISHGMSVTPNFFCVYAKTTTSPGTGYIVSGFGSKLGTSTGLISYIHGTTAAKGTVYVCNESTFNLWASSGKYKAGITYGWFAGVIKM